MCVFPWVFHYFRLRAFCLCLAFLPACCASKLHVLGPPNAPKSTPKSLQNRVSILTGLRLQICLVLDALWAPQNRPKIAPRTLWAHLEASWWPQLLLGGASTSPHAHFGCSWAHLDPPGGRFWLHLGPSWARFDPTKAQFGSTRSLDLNFLLCLNSARLFETPGPAECAGAL
jgi:hypothetical protein